MLFNLSRKTVTMVAVLVIALGGIFIYEYQRYQGKMEIIDINGDKIKINNIEIMKNAEAIGKTDLIFEDNSRYVLSFYRPDQSFAISVMAGDFESGRKEAEKKFLEDLGITAESACKLKVTLGTPAFVNEKYSGGNYGLSFCQNPEPKKNTTSGNSWLSKLINIFKNPLTVALGIAVLMLGGIIYYSRR